MLVIDTDCGIDDVSAILLCAHTRTIHALTTTSGNVDLEPANRVAQMLVQFLQTDTLIYSGCAQPMITRPVSRWFGHGSDGLGNASRLEEFQVFAQQHIGPLKTPIQQKHAVVALVEMAQKEPMDLICLGPLTNIAMAIQLDPQFLTRLKSFQVMGGSLQKGNSNRAAEFNFNYDPEACRMVFDAASKLDKPLVRLVPWETTVSHTLTWKYMDQLEDTVHTRLLRMITRSIRTENVIPSKGYIGLLQEPVLPDLIAMCAFLDHGTVLEEEAHNVSIELQGSMTLGMMCIDWYQTSKPNCMIVTKMDDAQITRLFETVFHAIK
ncbi:Inosine/uridine-preferring nucleoside hydrolase domain-containing protein [Gorgonomyces haynaldii]|nr:Inosine/uridine-preferring nucleoside hydrolase domain-containing protein [Gorgonomyces haynaldii]